MAVPNPFVEALKRLEQAGVPESVVDEFLDEHGDVDPQSLAPQLREFGREWLAQQSQAPPFVQALRRMQADVRAGRLPAPTLADPEGLVDDAAIDRMAERV